jgi:hypothetical protein
MGVARPVGEHRRAQEIYLSPAYENARPLCPTLPKSPPAQ